MIRIDLGELSAKEVFGPKSPLWPFLAGIGIGATGAFVLIVLVFS